jgi:aminoglycoside phosphotransferase (APT) family kinase protein
MESVIGDELPSRADPILGDVGWAAERYATSSGRSLELLDFYVVLGYLKLAGIAEGIHARYLAGETVGDGFERVGDSVDALLEAAHERARRSSIASLAGR